MLYCSVEISYRTKKCVLCIIADVTEKLGSQRRNRLDKGNE